MASSVSPSVDVRAPGGGRIVLRPVVPMDRLPGIGAGALAAVIVLCLVFLATSTNRLNHTDLWGHLNFGRWIAQHGTLPEADPFRSFADGQPFLNVPWLGQLLGYEMWRSLGLEGLVLGHALLVALAAAILMRAVCSRGVSIAWGATAAVAAYLLASPITGTIRPQLFGMVGFAATLWVLSRLHTHKAALVWLVPLFALWANLHGSFPMGLVVLGCWALGLSVESVAEGRRLGAAWSDRRVRGAWLAVALASGACCLNPLGFKLLAAVAGFAGNNNLTGISEWRALSIDSLSGALFCGSLLITALLLRVSPRRIRLGEVLLILVFGGTTLMAIRMLVWWALVWPWVVAPHAAAAWLLYRPVTPPRDEEETDARRAAAGRLLLAAACLAATLWWAPPTYALLSGNHREPSDVMSRGTPGQLAEELIENHASGRLYAPMDWADYLIWQTDGAVQPLVYSHVHLTSEALWGDFLRIDRGNEDWRDVARRYGLRYLVIDRARGGALARRIAAEGGYRILASDPQGLLIEIAGQPGPMAGSAASGRRVSQSEHVGANGRPSCSAARTPAASVLSGQNRAG